MVLKVFSFPKGRLKTGIDLNGFKIYNKYMSEEKSYINRAVNGVKDLFSRGGSKDFRRANPDSPDTYYTLYAATNENLAYLANLNVGDKDTLAVTGAGDHALNLAYFGAKSIETFDINKLANIAQDLKITALLHLSRNEFIDFYTTTNFFDRQIYHTKLRPYLNELTRAVFDTFLEYLRGFGGVSDYFEEFHKVDHNLLANNPYLSSEQAYRETQRRIRNLEKPINTLACSALEIASYVEPKDVIILSNVLRFCMEQAFKSEKLSFASPKHVEEFVKALSSILTEDGIASLLYIFGEWHDQNNKLIDEKALRDYFNVSGNILYVQDTLQPRQNRVFLAKKEDFPTFER